MGLSMRRLREDRKGGAALELALSLPMLLTINFGVVELGQGFVMRQNLVAAAAEAARVGSAPTCPPPTDAEVVAAANLTMQSAGLDPALATIGLTNVGGATGTDVVVNMTYAVEFPILSRLMGLASSTGGILDISVNVVAENE